MFKIRVGGGVSVFMTSLKCSQERNKSRNVQVRVATKGRP